jgi:hypothetical protein
MRRLRNGSGTAEGIKAPKLTTAVVGKRYNNAGYLGTSPREAQTRQRIEWKLFKGGPGPGSRGQCTGMGRGLNVVRKGYSPSQVSEEEEGNNGKKKM